MLDLISGALGGAQPLEQVKVTIGVLSGISPEALDFCFTEIALERGFGRPRLVVTEVEASLRCSDCGASYSTSDFYCACPACGSMNRTIRSGREFSVDSVEILTDEDEEVEEEPS